MSNDDPFFERLLGISEDRVIDVLRSIHRARSRSRPAASDPDWPTLPDPGPPNPSEPPPRLPAQSDWSTLAVPKVQPSPGEPEVYERARAHFAEVEQRLRGEAKVSDALIDGLRAREPATAQADAPRQQSLRLVALAGGLAGGRFVVANERAEPVELGFRHTGLRPIAPTQGSALELDPLVRFEPASLSLTPGGSQVVRVWIDLSDLPDLERRLELCVDVTDGARCEQKLFVEIEVHPLHGAPAPLETSGA